MFLISFLQLIAGNLFVIRTLQLFHARALLSKSVVTKIGTVFISTSALLGFVTAEDPFRCLLLLITGALLCLAALFACERHELRRLRDEFPLFLDRWILNLRLGYALSSAREAALKQQSQRFEMLLRPMFSTQVQRQRHLLFSTQVAHELHRLHAEAHLGLPRLENLRHMLRKSSEFRRKSGHAVRQTAIQSLVMLVLLFALSAHTLHRYGWKRSYDLIFIGIALSMVGVVTMCWVARKAKWKI